MLKPKRNGTELERRRGLFSFLENSGGREVLASIDRKYRVIQIFQSFGSVGTYLHGLTVSRKRVVMVVVVVVVVLRNTGSLRATSVRSVAALWAFSVV